MSRALRVDLLSPAESALAEGAAEIRRGGVIVYPTETVYGIGTSPFDQDALGRLQEVKRRVTPKPLIVLVRGIEDLMLLVREIPPAARILMDAFWPGPLTLLLPALTSLPPELTQGRKKIGVRVPSSPFCLKLMGLAGLPLTSTSANVTGENPLRSIDEMIAAFPPGVGLYFDAGELPPSPPSTVVDASEGGLTFVRDGAVSRESILRALQS